MSNTSKKPLTLGISPDARRAFQLAAQPLKYAKRQAIIATLGVAIGMSLGGNFHLLPIALLAGAFAGLGSFKTAYEYETGKYSPKYLEINLQKQPR